MIWFQLGREYKLSVAEILAVFPEWKTVYLSTDFLILDNIDEGKVLDKADTLWWTIKIVKIWSSSPLIKGIIGESIILDKAEKHEWKFKYWLSIFWENKNLKKILMTQKKELKSNKISSRFINKDFKNLSSAQIIWEKLIKRNTDFNYIYTTDNIYFWVWIWVQDINSYSKRDYSKDRDMQVGMLPPKLCQMMINLSKPLPNPPLQGEGIKQVIYDPFVWLGTVLIESILMWNKEVYGSDLNERMVEKSTKNIEKIPNNDVKIEIFQQNSKYIDEVKILNKIDSIVTEWYLWEVMTKKNISIERIEKQRKSLLDLYNWFFKWLKNSKYKWNIVISFPFWEMKWKYFYFTEIYDILKQYCNIKQLLPNSLDIQTTKSWSLLYKRDKQLVWREIFKLRIK